MSALLEIAWGEVRHLSIGQTEMSIALKNGGVRSYYFDSPEMCDTALAAWCKTTDARRNLKPARKRLRP